MEASKKWNVTFTKHLKQKLKRKVYRNGFLSLRNSIGKSFERRHSFVEFWSKVHYNSLYEIQDAPIPQKLKKKHWFF